MQSSLLALLVIAPSASLLRDIMADARCQVVSATLNPLARAIHVLLDSLLIEVLSEVISYILCSSDIFDSDLTLRHFVLDPKLVDFDVSNLAHASS